jgi:hypothetical protein
MTISFIGRFSFDQLFKINNYIKANEVEIYLLQKPIYIHDCKIERNKNNILITT